MNVLLIDRGGFMTDFALRCKAAGHTVRWCLGKLKSGERNPQGDGFGLDKRGEWETSMRWADLIVLPDNAFWMGDVERWHRKGFPIFGPNLEGARLELDRQYGMEVLRQVGIPLIPSHRFRRLSEAIEFLHRKPARYVSKPDNDGGNKALSYVGKSAKDLLFMMERWRKAGGVDGALMLQEFCPGIEVAVGGWFGPAGFSPWFLENFEHKKFMAGDVGVNTGEMGTVMRYTQTSALAEYLLRPLEGHLYRMEYAGYIDVAAIVGKDGRPYPLEFTTRPGWPLFEIQQSLHPEPVEWMADMLQGGSAFKPRTSVAVGVVMAIPDFPYNKAPHATKCGFPVYGWEEVPEANFHPSQVMLGEAPGDKLSPEPAVVTAGDCVCTVSGNGPSVEAAAKAAYRNVKRIEIPNSPMYRTDIGRRLEEQLPQLQRHGWCEGWTYGTS